MRFPLFNDADIGLDNELIKECQIEARIDDDCDTDEEIMRQADDNVQQDCLLSYL